MRVYASPIATDCRLEQPVTPETVYSPTTTGRLDTPKNLILCLARAGFEPTTFSTAVQCLTTGPTRQAKKTAKWQRRGLIVLHRPLLRSVDLGVVHPLNKFPHKFLLRKLHIWTGIERVAFCEHRILLIPRLCFSTLILTTNVLLSIALYFSTYSCM